MTRKFRALTDGPGWKKGDVFERPEDCLAYLKLIAPGQWQAYPHFQWDQMTSPYFEEIKPRKIAVYEVDVTPWMKPPVTLWFENMAVDLVRIEDRE